MGADAARPRFPRAFPRVATRVEISLVDKDGSATLFLSGTTDGKEGQRIKKKVFDLRYLTAVLKPKRVVTWISGERVNGPSNGVVSG